MLTPAGSPAPPPSSRRFWFVVTALFALTALLFIAAALAVPG